MTHSPPTELTAVRSLTEHVPDASDDALARGRIALLAVTQNEAFAPAASTVRRPGRGRLTAALGALAPRRTPPRLLAGIAAAAAIAVGVQALQVAAPNGAGVSSAAAALNKAADATITTVDPTVGPNQYVQVTTKRRYDVSPTINGKTVRYFVTQTSDLWVPGDLDKPWALRSSGESSEDTRSLRERQQLEGPYYLIAKDGNFVPSENRAVGNDWRNPSPAYLATLPRDPRQLLTRINTVSGWGCSKCVGEGPSKDSEAFTYVSDLLQIGYVPADLRAALYKALALTPGVVIAEQRASLDGRTGVAFSQGDPENGVRDELVIAPDTGQLVGSRTVVADATTWDLPVDTVVSSTTYTASVTDGLPDQPVVVRAA